MSEFNWEIGTVPHGWRRSDGAPRVTNGDFKYGPRAMMHPAYSFSCIDDPMPNISAYHFFPGDAPKVRAWLRRFMESGDVASKEEPNP